MVMLLLLPTVCSQRQITGLCSVPQLCRQHRQGSSAQRKGCVVCLLPALLPTCVRPRQHKDARQHQSSPD